MKVLIFQPLDDGGIAHYTHNLCLALAGLGGEVLLYTGSNYELRDQASGYAVRPAMFRLAGALVRRSRWLSGEKGLAMILRRVLKLLEYPWDASVCAWTARTRKFDVVHVQTVNNIDLVLVALAKALGMRVVFTVHNISPRHGRITRGHRAIFALLCRLCDHIVIHTAQGKKQLVELFRADPERVSVIPIGDFKFFVGSAPPSVGAARALCGLPAASKVMLFFGAIRPSKGLDVLIRALPMVRASVPEAKLLVCGEPCENYDRYRALAMAAGVGDMVVERLDYIPNEEVQNQFMAADVVVLPYREITQSGVLQVAYAFGKPVVASAVGGFPESVEDGRNGFLVPPGDAAGLAQAIVAILGDSNLRGTMGNRSRFLADAGCSWQEIARKTITVYEKSEPSAKRQPWL